MKFSRQRVHLLLRKGGVAKCNLGPAQTMWRCSLKGGAGWDSCAVEAGNYLI